MRTGGPLPKGEMQRRDSRYDLCLTTIFEPPDAVSRGWNTGDCRDDRSKASRTAWNDRLEKAGKCNIIKPFHWNGHPGTD
jgi:hypothetical protein